MRFHFSAQNNGFVNCVRLAYTEDTKEFVVVVVEKVVFNKSIDATFQFNTYNNIIIPTDILTHANVR